jgi:hypothetical protein
MNLETVLNVFKNSTLVTGKGEFPISRVFHTIKEARKAKYIYYCAADGTLVFRRQNNNGENKYAVIG